MSFPLNKTIQQALLPIHIPKDLINLIVLYTPAIDLQDRKEVIHELNYKFREVEDNQGLVCWFSYEDFLFNLPTSGLKTWIQSRIFFNSEELRKQLIKSYRYVPCKISPK